MIWIFEVVSPGCDLDGELWEVTDVSPARAEARAESRLIDTFAMASPERRAVTTIRLVGSRSAGRRAA